MVNRIFDLYDDLEKDRIMLSFTGALSSDLIAAILNLVERKLDHCEHAPAVRKRVFNVVMECLHNLFHHNKHRAAAGSSPGHGEGGQGVVVIAHDGRGYSVFTGNAMAQSEVEALKQRLDLLNGCGPDELRELYKNTLNNGTFSPSGGGGLGLIDMARRSGRKLEYGFVPLDNNNTFFSLNVNIAPNNHPSHHERHSP